MQEMDSHKTKDCRVNLLPHSPTPQKVVMKEKKAKESTQTYYLLNKIDLK